MNVDEAILLADLSQALLASDQEATRRVEAAVRKKPFSRAFLQQLNLLFSHPTERVNAMTLLIPQKPCVHLMQVLESILEQIRGSSEIDAIFAVLPAGLNLRVLDLERILPQLALWSERVMATEILVRKSPGFRIWSYELLRLLRLVNEDFFRVQMFQTLCPCLLFSDEHDLQDAIQLIQKDQAKQACLDKLPARLVLVSAPLSMDCVLAIVSQFKDADRKLMAFETLVQVVHPLDSHAWTQITSKLEQCFQDHTDQRNLAWSLLTSRFPLARKADEKRIKPSKSLKLQKEQKQQQKRKLPDKETSREKPKKPNARKGEKSRKRQVQKDETAREKSKVQKERKPKTLKPPKEKKAKAGPVSIRINGRSVTLDESWKPGESHDVPVSKRVATITLLSATEVVVRGEGITSVGPIKKSRIVSVRLSSAGSVPVIEPSAQPNSCCVCLDTPRNMLLMPCKHLACCEPCANKVQTCPLCRKAIEDRIKVYA